MPMIICYYYIITPYIIERNAKEALENLELASNELMQRLMYNMMIIVIFLIP